jgi:hypothetical protein
MKRGTLDHPKAHDLAKRLAIPRFQVAGILECLWHFGSLYAWHGDVGRFTDAQIAAWMGWPEDDAGRLVQALADSHWLDPDPVCRYAIHDWRDHADDGVQKRLQRETNQAAKHVQPSQPKPVLVATCPDMSRHVTPALSLLPSALSLLPEPEPKTCSVRTERERVAIGIYDAYPRKVGRKDALAAIVKALAGTDKPITAAELLAHVKDYADSQAGRPDTEHIPYPATWFNARRWEDDHREWLAWKTAAAPSLPAAPQHPNDPGYEARKLAGREHW